MTFAAILAMAAGKRLVFFRPRKLWMRSIAGSISLVCGFYAMTHYPVSEVLTLTNMFPLWVAVLSLPLFAILGQRLVDHIFQIGREILQVILQRRRRLVNDLEQRRGGIFAIEGHHAGEQFVEHDAAGKDIGAAIHHLGVDLLGRHVSDGADHLAGAGHGIVANAGDAEIHDLAIAVAQHHEIGGLDVAMDDAAAVRVSQAIAGLHDVSQLFYDGDLPVAGDDLIERLAVEELHHQIGIALMIAQVIDDDDVGVLQHAGGFGLTVEALEQVGILGKAAGHHLDGDDALDEVIHRLVHDAHAALAQNLNDVVLADFGDRFL